MQRLDRRDGKRKVFAIKVRVKKKNGHPRYIYGLGDKRHPAKRDFAAAGEYSHEDEIKTVHIYANNVKKANQEAKKYGIVLNGQEGHSQKSIYGNIERVLEKDKRKERHGTPIELDEFPWMYKKREEERQKVRERRDNIVKEKGRLLLDF